MLELIGAIFSSNRIKISILYAEEISKEEIFFNGVCIMAESVPITVKLKFS